MRAARRAAPSVARPTTTIRMTTVAASVHGSVGLIPNSIVRRNCDSTSAPSRPTATPTAARRAPCPRTSVEDAADGRAERDAHADLVPPLAHGVGDDAVQAERREQHGHQREGVDQPRREPPRRELRGDQLLAAAHGIDRQVRIDRLHGLLRPPRRTAARPGRSPRPPAPAWTPAAATDRSADGSGRRCRPPSRRETTPTIVIHGALAGTWPRRLTKRKRRPSGSSPRK